MSRLASSACRSSTEILAHCWLQLFDHTSLSMAWNQVMWSCMRSSSTESISVRREVDLKGQQLSQLTVIVCSSRKRRSMRLPFCWVCSCPWASLEGCRMLMRFECRVRLKPLAFTSRGSIRPVYDWTHLRRLGPTKFAWQSEGHLLRGQT